VRGNGKRANSVLIDILPFIEQQPLWERISNPFQAGGRTYPAMGVQVTRNNARPGNNSNPIYEPWRTQVNTYRCPSDPIFHGGVAQTN